MKGRKLSELDNWAKSKTTKKYLTLTCSHLIKMTTMQAPAGHKVKMWFQLSHLVMHIDQNKWKVRNFHFILCCTDTAWSCCSLFYSVCLEEKSFCCFNNTLRWFNDGWGFRTLNQLARMTSVSQTCAAITEIRKNATKHNEYADIT